jgi:membrane protease YdiL (CAAX protease family)
MTQPDTRRILTFLAFAFGLAWLVGLIVFLTGGLVNSPPLIPGTGFTLAFALIATGYMWSPAIANFLTRLITRESWRGSGLRPQLKRGWPYWLAAWVLPAVLTLAGMGLFFGLYPAYFDPALGVIRQMLAQAGPADTPDPWVIVVVQTIQAILLAPVINSLFTFGEEFGWRGYLLPKLMPLGGRRAMILGGIIWGVWHWPVIAMGHNYGLDYPGAPWLGVLAMTWFTITSGTFLGWITLRGGSVWPAVIGHAAINGIAGLAILLVQGQPNPLIGPLVTGVVGGLPWALLAVALLLWPGTLEIPATVEPASTQEPTGTPATR